MTWNVWLTRRVWRRQMVVQTGWIRHWCHSRNWPGSRRRCRRLLHRRCRCHRLRHVLHRTCLCLRDPATGAPYRQHHRVRLPTKTGSSGSFRSLCSNNGLRMRSPCGWHCGVEAASRYHCGHCTSAMIGLRYHHHRLRLRPVLLHRPSSRSWEFDPFLVWAFAPFLPRPGGGRKRKMKIIVSFIFKTIKIWYNLPVWLGRKRFVVGQTGSAGDVAVSEIRSEWQWPNGMSFSECLSRRTFHHERIHPAAYFFRRGQSHIHHHAIE
jgi:hypothetical protein